MASVHLRYVYYSAKPGEEQGKNLFYVKKKQYINTYISQGLRLFIQLLKSEYAELAYEYYVNSGFIDLLLGDTYGERTDAVIEAVRLLVEVGFMINKENISICTK